MKHPRPFPAKARNAIIAALVLLLLAAGAVYRYRSQPVPPLTQMVATTPSAEEYRSAAQSAVTVFVTALSVGELDSVAAERERLLAMKVPKEYKDLHIGLVLTADALGSGDQAKARNLLSGLQAEYPWVSN